MRGSSIESGLSFPKPRRAVDPKLLREYARAHPRCEIQDCKERPGPQPHHIRPRSLGRDDRHENLLRLCGTHHQAFHGLKVREWLRRYGYRLLPEARKKVERAVA